MLQYVEYLINAGITITLGAAVFGWWLANRKRIAAETVGRAEERALSIVKDAERDAETRKKEALLEAKEKAHEVLVDAEREDGAAGAGLARGWRRRRPEWQRRFQRMGHEYANRASRSSDRRSAAVGQQPSGGAHRQQNALTRCRGGGR